MLYICITDTYFLILGIFLCWEIWEYYDNADYCNIMNILLFIIMNIMKKCLYKKLKD